MKRPCALISLTLIFALMLSLSATAHANESLLLTLGMIHLLSGII